LGLSRKVVRKVIRSSKTEFHYERERQPLPKIAHGESGAVAVQKFQFLQASPKHTFNSFDHGLVR
jgi:hypothetical protein